MKSWPQIDWSRCSAVETRPGALGGKWVFTGTRVPLYLLFVNLASGVMTAEHFADVYRVDGQQVKEALSHLAECLEQTPREATRLAEEPVSV